MCTLSIFKTSKEGIIVTSNRDEHMARPTLPPQVYSVGGMDVVFPKDELKNGTWLAMGANGVVVCVLNGGFEPHQMGRVFAKSRGQIVLDVFRNGSVASFLDHLDCTGVEPFTLVLLDTQSEEITEVVWDENKIHHRPVAMDKPLLWSSTSLYAPKVREERKILFENWINKGNKHSKDVRTLHVEPKEKGGFLLPPHSFLKTVSVSQIIVGSLRAEFEYSDLIQGTEHSVGLKF